jgi:hypothetical protein
MFVTSDKFCYFEEIGFFPSYLKLSEKYFIVQLLSIFL